MTLRRRTSKSNEFFEASRPRERGPSFPCGSIARGSGPHIVHVAAGDSPTYPLAKYFEGHEDGASLTGSGSQNGTSIDVEVPDGVLRLIGAGCLNVEAVTVREADGGGETVSRSFRVLARPCETASVRLR